MLYADVATQESDGGCEGSDAEMIGNGRRGAGDRNRDLEEDDELESREERGSESGGGGGGFGGWRSHLLGGLTQRVKSWYWGARPLVSFPIERESLTLFLLIRTISFYLSFSLHFPFSSFILSLSIPFPLRRHLALRTDSRKGERTRASVKGEKNGSERTSEKFLSKTEFDIFRRYFSLVYIHFINTYFTI